MALEEICDQVAAYHPRHVTVTGGEPLAQKEVLPLLTRLCDAGYEVSLETSGSIALDGVDSRVVTVMDIKTPGSGEMEKNHWENLEQLSAKDQIKFVLCDRKDYDWAREQLLAHDLPTRFEVLFSPVQDHLDPTELADWILADNLPVRFQLQLHKILWGNEAGR